MTLDFDLENVVTTEFGVGRDDGEAQTFVAVTVDADVQAALQEVAAATWEAMKGQSSDPPKYQPSEKHGAVEYLQLPLDDGLAATVRELHDATNIPVAADVLNDVSRVF